MSVEDPITRILSVFSKYLKKNNIDYVFVGGVSILVFGRIRMTTEVDIILDHKKIDRKDFVKYLKNEGFDANLSNFDLLDEQIHSSIFLKEGMFRVDMKGIYSKKEQTSVDLAIDAEFNGITCKFDDPNSIIVNKLDFGSEQDYEDAIAVYIKSHELINFNKLQSIAKIIGIQDKLNAFIKDVEKYNS